MTMVSDSLVLRRSSVRSDRRLQPSPQVSDRLQISKGQSALWRCRELLPSRETTSK
jgi:hypothetical protein